MTLAKIRKAKSSQRCLRLRFFPGGGFDGELFGRRVFGK